MPDRRPPARTFRPRESRPTGAAAYAGQHEIDTGWVDLVPEDNRQLRWLVVVNGVPSSYVDLTDPTRLEFEYTRWIGDLIDVVSEPGTPLHGTHLGGAGCSLARYVTATRPGSRQVVFEYDARLATVMRQAFGLRGERGMRLRSGEGRAGVAELAESSTDLVVRDAFVGNQVPRHLATVEFAREVSRVLTPGGVYAANVADATGGRQARLEAVSALEVFEHVALVGEPAHFRGRQHGYRNVVLLASDRELPTGELTRRLASGAIRARLVPTDRVRELVAGLRPRHDRPAEQDATSDLEDAADEPELEPDDDTRSVGFLR